jgi:hypothetical protein
LLCFGMVVELSIANGGFAHLDCFVSGVTGGGAVFT